MEKLLNVLCVLILMHEGGCSESSPFPFLNTSTMVMLDENNLPVTAYFSMPKTSTRSGLDFERNLNEIDFTLYTRKNLKGVTMKHASELANTTFDKEKPTKFVTHGWLSSGNADTCQEIKDGYMDNSDVNVIILNWKSIANDIYYITPMSSVPDVSRYLASFINYMVEKMDVSTKNIHLIGHSLGAQVSGLAWKNMNGRKPGRVTGLDPAYPGFDDIVMFNEKISPESADFVDIIHSCAGLLGLPQDIGHVDFYPNGGCSTQPGCRHIFQACSHGRSWQFYADSVQHPNRTFKAHKCDNYDKFKKNKCKDSEVIVMGDGTPSTARGSYYLQTNSKKPFAMTE